MTGQSSEPLTEQVENLLSSEAGRIELHRVVSDEVRRVILAVQAGPYSVDGPASAEIFADRVRAYDSLLAGLAKVQAALAAWGTAGNALTVSLSPLRIADSIGQAGGNSVLLGLRWYPVATLLYAGGVAAVAAKRYDHVGALLGGSVESLSGRGLWDLSQAVPKGLGPAIDSFKTIPGLERRHTPFNDHLFSHLQPILDSLLLLGADYERAFDRFEVLLCLEYAHQGDGGWGPAGRFAWKMGYPESSPFHLVAGEARNAGNAWPPLASGLFGGSGARLADVLQQVESAFARRRF